MSTQATVFIVDDDPGVRDSLKYMIESGGYRVEAFENARQMIDRARAMVSGCLVADLRLPGMSGLDMFDKLREIGVNLPTIVITGHGDVTAAVRAMKAGALDFIEKPFSDQALLDRIGTAMQINSANQVAAQEIAQVDHCYQRLTPRERQVMAAVVEGRLNKQIASDLRLSHKTIEVHRAHVMEKMSAKSLAELVRMAVLLEQHCHV
ncbi:response regulator transcription factor [Algisphaera agarilytica]|uniref:FixJ family two-component response regulator n=1 Tax=Algisphaera agarilytica TaxID=1385975 RepID=A0A7X0HA12_9BACT|nr:response regulator [Algisphaera agarilytica]MBB6430585.1 FixJ family two-component response regulator [Algisphaera agarilytica]